MAPSHLLHTADSNMVVAAAMDHLVQEGTVATGHEQISLES